MSGNVKTCDGPTNQPTKFWLYSSTDVENCNVLVGLDSTSELINPFKTVSNLVFKLENLQNLKTWKIWETWKTFNF